MAHFAWKYWDPEFRQWICTVLPFMMDYAKLRLKATRMDVSVLRQPRPPLSNHPISENRVELIGALILMYNGNYGDALRYMRGPFTGEHRDWQGVFQEL